MIFHCHSLFCLAFDYSSFIKKYFLKEKIGPFSYQDSIKRRDPSEQIILAMHTMYTGKLQTPKEDLNSGHLNSTIYTLTYPRCTADLSYSSIHPKPKQTRDSLARLVKRQMQPPLASLEAR